jgi:hypothetical protein
MLALRSQWIVQVPVYATGGKVSVPSARGPRAVSGAREREKRKARAISVLGWA